MRTHRRTAAVVADGHRGRVGHRWPRRHRGDRHGSHRKRAGRGGAQRHVHSGFRARRLPSDRAATQLLAADPRAAVHRVVGAANPRGRSAAGRDRRVRGRATRRLHAAWRRNARPRLAFRIGLRHPLGGDGIRQAAWPVPRSAGGRTRPGGHPVVRPDGRPVRGDEQAHAPRACGPQRALRSRACRARLHRNQAGVRTRIRRVPQCFRRRASPRRRGAHGSASAGDGKHRSSWSSRTPRWVAYTARSTPPAGYAHRSTRNASCISTSPSAPRSTSTGGGLQSARHSDRGADAPRVRHGRSTSGRQRAA